jgi:hypothetical protein
LEKLLSFLADLGDGKMLVMAWDRALGKLVISSSSSHIDYIKLGGKYEILKTLK